MKKDLKNKISWFVFAFLIIAIYKLLDNFGEITAWIEGLISTLMPFIMAVLIAYLLYIPCMKVERFYEKAKPKFIKKIARWLAIFTVYIIAIALIVLIMKFIIPTVYESLVELVSAIPRILQ